ncbi:MAG: 50S ribosomal protein L16 [Planctomycetes bacterium]|nr:50S ribosomal protein L16 [Planctomycetota bacterium]
MGLIPAKYKYRKTQRGRIGGTAYSGCNLNFGDYGIQATSPGWVNSQQIESARVVARHYTGVLGKLIIRIFPHRNYTSRPAETRMGKGKGMPEKWFADVRPGHILFELSGVSEEVAREAFRRQAHKLPVKTRFVSKKTYENFRDKN